MKFKRGQVVRYVGNVAKLRGLLGIVVEDERRTEFGPRAIVIFEDAPKAGRHDAYTTSLERVSI